MKYKFKVEYMLKVREHTVIFARQQEKYYFELGDFPTLGGYPIKKSFDIPRILRKDGNLELDVFCFFLIDSNDTEKFIKGEIVELQP